MMSPSLAAGVPALPAPLPRTRACRGRQRVRAARHPVLAVLLAALLAAPPAGCGLPGAPPEPEPAARPPWRMVFELALGLAAEDRDGPLARRAAGRRLEEVAAVVREVQRAEPAAQAGRALARALFERLGFRTVQGGPCSPPPREAFDVDRVLEHRRGSCLALAVIALAAAESAGLEAVPLLGPDHVLVLVEPGVLIDPAAGGVVLGPPPPAAPPAPGAGAGARYRLAGPEGLVAALFANRAVYRRAAGRHQAALSDLERALALDPASVTARLNRAVVLLDLGRFAQARAELEQLEASGLGTALGAYNLGVLAAREGTLGVAKHWYATALERDPRLVAAWVNKAAVHERLEEPAEAAACYRAALALEPDNVPARSALARLHRGEDPRAAPPLAPAGVPLPEAGARAAGR
ncbi:MAG: hypothetical protein KatS3mg102_2141 [Planctomycetota bacterium]|nr:MAG: hypothetical protein KatS3mg102_2141 [Planctomycetota bacterium]